MQSNNLDETTLSQPKESSLLPLSELDYSGLKKTFILTDDDLSSFIQTQHVYINELLRIKNNPEVLRNDFNRMGLSDFKAFSQDTMFLWFQKSQVVKSILEALDIQITKEDEVGRITDIHYDD